MPFSALLEVDTMDKIAAAECAFLAMYAEDMRRETDTGSKVLAPDPDPRLEADHEVVAYLVANDAIFSASPHMQVGPQRLYYGYVARSKVDPTSWTVGVRGTEGIVEWIIDGQFLPQSHPRGGGIEVEHGFWSIYETLQLVEPDGQLKNADAAAGISALVGSDEVTVVGHSLGSALATYLCFDLERHLGKQVRACLFASPRTGNDAWVDAVAATLQDRCTVFNYLLDLVPHLPSRPGYSTVRNELVILPSTAEAGVKVEVRSHHHVLCYAAMLSYATFQAHEGALRDVDAEERACVLGDHSMVPAQAKALQVAVEAVDGAGLSVAGFLRTIIAFGVEQRKARV